MEGRKSRGVALSLTFVCVTLTTKPGLTEPVGEKKEIEMKSKNCVIKKKKKKELRL